jgi:hypothetical protein
MAYEAGYDSEQILDIGSALCQVKMNKSSVNLLQFLDTGRIFAENFSKEFSQL